MPFLSLAYSSKPLSWLLNERKRVGEEERRVGWGEEKEVARGRGTEGEAKKETKPELPELHRLPHRLTLGLHKSLQVSYLQKPEQPLGGITVILIRLF